MNVDIIFKIAGIGVLTTVLNQLLTKWGREDIATVTTVVGLVTVLFMAVNEVAEFFETVKSAFSLY